MSQPVIQYSTTQNYGQVWADHGSGADSDVGFWRPELADGQWFLGDYAQNGYNSPWQSMAFITGVLNDDPNNPALVAPQSYTPIWWYMTWFNFVQWNLNVIWNVVPPNGYLACGSVVSQSGIINVNDPIPTPTIPGLVCVRQDLVESNPGSNLAWVWNDKGSGNNNDVGAWLVPRLNNFVAVPNYDQPNAYYTPNNAPHFHHNYGHRR